MSSATGAVMVGILSMTLAQTLGGPPPMDDPLTTRAVVDSIVRQEHFLSPQHVAQLGGELFGRHLIAVEVAGTLLLAAVVGASVIVAHGQVRPRKPSAQSED